MVLLNCPQAAEGDKYKVAKKWAYELGHIRIVTRKWFDQSVAKRVCLAEESYPVRGGSASSNTGMKGSLAAKFSLEKNIGNSQSTQPSLASDSNMQAAASSGNVDLELEATLSQSFSVKVGEHKAPQVEPEADLRFDDCVAKDSDDDDLYLSDCKICLVGFNASDMRKLISMILKGGGSRFTSYSERLTHIVVGSPSDIERKELRGLAAVGVIHVVHPSWLEDCDRAKKEIPVMQRHMAHDLLLPKDLIGSSLKGSITGRGSMKQEKASTMPSSVSVDPSSEVLKSRHAKLFEESKGQEADVKIKGGLVLGETLSSSQHSLPVVIDELESQKKVQHTGNLKIVPGNNYSGVFMGKLFCFSKSFPQDRSDEVVEWISQGGGTIVDDHLKKNVDFTVECHGVPPQSSSSLQTTHVSSHWVRSCLAGGVLLDVASHMLYSPLPCRIPLPGFEHYRFCVSQYEEKDRLLLKNLCFVLGAKFGEKLTKRTTHLLCKFSSGPKFQACPNWGIEPVTCEWIYECIRQDGVVALDSFRPKEPSARDLKAGLCTLSQYPTQAVQMLSGDSSQLMIQSLDLRKPVTQNANMLASSSRKEAEATMKPSKKARLFGTVCSVDDQDLLSRSDKVTPANLSPRGGNAQQDNNSIPVNPEMRQGLRSQDERTLTSNKQQYVKENPQVADVAAAIEDLLEQTTKIHDMSTPGGTEIKQIFLSDPPALGTYPAVSHTTFGPSTHWLSRVEKQDEAHKPSRDGNPGIHDGFSETQSESQLVSYEEDLSGRQMIIERVRTRSSALE